jgi:trimeric autotransporter adhesin
VSPREVLGRVVSLPIETWNYLSQGPSVRHIGPMAQDFHTAFGVGEDDTQINMVDANGVALAAIQGLYQLVQEQELQLTALEARLAALDAREPALATI